MAHDQSTWQLAKRMLEQHGLHAMYGARAVSADLHGADGDGQDATCLDIVRAMDFLLSDEGRGTIH
jgi:hypothetical protein